MTRLLLADDHDLVRETIADFLHRQAGYEVVQAPDLEAALALARGAEDLALVLLDYQMPGMNGMEGITRMMEATMAPVAVLSGTAPADVARQCMAQGARGFLPKTLAPDALVAAVKVIEGGETYLPLDYIREAQEARDKARISLTPREQDVLRGLSEGKSNKEIARDLEIQEVTVKLHVKTMSRKLGAKNRTHAAMLGRDMGFS